MVEVAVLGRGNGAYAAAADLAAHGHRVRLWRRDAESLAPLEAQGGIRLKDAAGERLVPLAVMTGDIGRALAGADIILVPNPAFSQAAIARAMAAHLAEGQVIFLPPGTFGSYVMARALREAGCAAAVALAETGTLPYLARKHGPGTIAISVRATRLPTGVFPAAEADRARAALGALYPIEPEADALAAALLNAGPIIHPPLILMNAAPLQHFERWDIHKEGTQPAIRRVTDALDGERIAIREALGYGAPHFPLADHYRSDGEEWMYGRQAHAKLTDSGDWRERIDLETHRYMTEDVAMGLAFLVSVGSWAGVETPVAAGLLALGSAILGRDLRQGARSLEGLGLAGLSREEMRSLLAAGLPA